MWFFNFFKLIEKDILVIRIFSLGLIDGSFKGFINIINILIINLYG